MARKTPGKGIKENTLQCYIDYSKIVLMEKGACLNTPIYKLYCEIRNVIPKHVQIWRRNKIKYRKGKFAKQNENYQTDWADVEWHKSRAKTMNSPILSQEH